MMYCVSNELSHYGVRGMKWGIRKQRPMVIGRSRSKSYESADQQKAARRARAKRAAKIGAGIAVGVLAAYGGYKVYKLQGKAVDSLAQKSMNAGRQYMNAYYNGQSTRAHIMNYADKAKLNGLRDSMQLHIDNANAVERRANVYYDMADKEIGRAARRDYSRKEVMQEMKRQIKKRKY